MIWRAKRAKYRIFLMAIADILIEIDAYLLRLHDARALLASVKDTKPKGARRTQKKPNLRKPDFSMASKPRIREAKSQSKPPMVPALQLPALVSHQGHAERSTAVPAEPAPPDNLNPNVVPIKKLRPSLRGARRGLAKPALIAETDKIKPAIALSGSMNRIVVVSPEQLQRDRTANAVKPEVRRPRVPSTGQSGRLAFEALFKDTIDPSKSSGQ